MHSIVLSQYQHLTGYKYFDINYSHSFYSDTLCGKNVKMVNWVLGLLIFAVGTAFVPSPHPTRDDLYKCQEPGCNRTFMTISGRQKHFKRVHQGVSNTRVSCKHGCGKSYSINSHNSLKLHERTCERNPNR